MRLLEVAVGGRHDGRAHALEDIAVWTHERRRFPTQGVVTWNMYSMSKTMLLRRYGDGGRVNKEGKAAMSLPYPRTQKGRRYEGGEQVYLKRVVLANVATDARTKDCRRRAHPRFSYQISMTRVFTLTPLASPCPGQV